MTKSKPEQSKDFDVIIRHQRYNRESLTNIAQANRFLLSYFKFIRHFGLQFFCGGNDNLGFRRIGEISQRSVQHNI